MYWSYRKKNHENIPICLGMAEIVLINPKHYAKLTCYHPGNHCGKKKKKKSTAGSNSSMS